ncbi:MAG: DUF4340 domain-containing protein [Candidatus Omnitrophota bacterium]
MKLKKLLMILGILLFLFALVIVKKSVREREAGKEDAGNEIAGEYELVREIPEAFLSKIVIYKGSDEKDKVILSKNKDDMWVVENKFGAKALKTAIDDLLKELKGLKGEVRGDSKELFPDFQIEDERSVHLVLEGGEGNVLKHLAISFLTPSWNKNFIRSADSPNIVLVNKNLLVKLNIFGKDDTLRSLPFVDMKLFAFDPQGIYGITLEPSGKDKIVLKKHEPESSGNYAWKFEPAAKGEEPNRDRADSFVRGISNIYFTDVMDPVLKIYGLDGPLFRLELSDKDGKTAMHMDVGNYIDPEKSYYVKTSLSDNVFKVQEAYIAGIKEGRASFLTAEPEPPKDTKK